MLRTYLHVAVQRVFGKASTPTAARLLPNQMALCTAAISDVLGTWLHWPKLRINSGDKRKERILDTSNRETGTLSQLASPRDHRLSGEALSHLTQLKRLKDLNLSGIELICKKRRCVKADVTQHPPH